MEPTYFKMFCWFCVLMYINCSDMNICKFKMGNRLLPIPSCLLLN